MLTCAHFQMIPVVCLAAVGGSVFLRHDLLHIPEMLRGLSVGIVYTANLLLIRRYVISKMRKNAIALSCAIRLISGLVMPQIDVDEVYRGAILIGLSLLAGAFVICCGMQKGKDRVWDEYYESYFERNNSKVSEEGESVLYKLRYFLVMLGMRIPVLLLTNNVTTTIQRGFLRSFSETVASYSYLTSAFFVVLLLMTAFHHPSTRSSNSSLKYLIIPGSYIAFVLLLANVPLSYLTVQQQGGFCLLAIIIINFLLDTVYNGGLIYLLDTLLVKSRLKNVGLSVVIALEIILLSLVENAAATTDFLQTVTLPGFFGILTTAILVPIILYHTQLEN